MFCSGCRRPFSPPLGLFGTNDVPCPHCHCCYTAVPRDQLKRRAIDELADHLTPKATETFNFRLSHQDRKRLMILAAHLKTSASEVLRSLIRLEHQQITKRKSAGSPERGDPAEG